MSNFEWAWLESYHARMAALGRASATAPAAEPFRPTKLPRSSQHEWRAQEGDAEFLDLALPPGAFWTSIETKADSAKAGALRKKRGVKAGTPDIVIVWNGMTIWIERKVRAGVSDSQKRVRDLLVKNGHHWFVARSTADIEAALRGLSVPLRASTGRMR